MNAWIYLFNSFIEGNIGSGGYIECVLFVHIFENVTSGLYKVSSAAFIFLSETQNTSSAIPWLTTLRRCYHWRDVDYLSRRSSVWEFVRYWIVARPSVVRKFLLLGRSFVGLLTLYFPVEMMGVGDGGRWSGVWGYGLRTGLRPEGYGQKYGPSRAFYNYYFTSARPPQLFQQLQVAM